MLSDLQTPGTGRHSDFTMKLIKPELKTLKSLKINAEIWATAEVGSLSWTVLRTSFVAF